MTKEILLCRARDISHRQSMHCPLRCLDVCRIAGDSLSLAIAVAFEVQRRPLLRPARSFKFLRRMRSFRPVLHLAIAK
jgi:hypothetical protein